MWKIALSFFVTCHILAAHPAFSHAENWATNLVWQQVNRGLRDIDLRTIAVSPDNAGVVYLASSKALYKTINGGKSWSEIVSFKGTANAITTLAIDPLNSAIVLAGTMDGLYMSGDRGKNWKRAFTGFGGLEASILSVAIHPVEPGAIFIGTKAGLFRSDSGGKGWKRIQQIPTNAVVSSLSLTSSKPHTLFAATDRGVFRRREGDKGWERLPVDFSPIAREIVEETYEETVNGVTPDMRWVMVDPTDDETIYLATSDGLLISHDSGMNWRHGGNTGLVSRDIRNLAVTSSEPEAIYGATKRGVFRYNEQSRSWSPLYKGLTSSDVRFIAAGQNDSPILWAATRRGAFIAVAVQEGEIAVQGGEEAEKILSHIGDEPTINELLRAAIEYAEVAPGKIKRWRSAAAKKAWLPDLRVAYDKASDWQSSTYFYSTTTQKYTDDDITSGRDWAWSVSATWDLGELVWNNDQTSIDTRSRLMVQLRDDVLNEVTRLYFERKRLQAELLHSPPQGVMEKVEKELRFQELTADIDALTGFYLSMRLERAKAPH